MTIFQGKKKIGKKNSLSLEVLLRQGRVSNACPKQCWITRTVHIAQGRWRHAGPQVSWEEGYKLTA